MPRPIPAWKASRSAALAAWREALAPEMRAEVDAAWAEAKANAAARRSARAERERELIALTLKGLSADEIADRTGEDRRTTRRRLAALGVGRAPSGMRRAPAAWIKSETRAAIEALAAERGAAPEEIVSFALTFLFEDGAPKARALLRNTAFKSSARSAA